MADDVDYYRRCREVFIKPPEMPLRVQHAGEVGLPLRLRPVHRPRAALVPVARRDQRPLQPALSDLLRRAADPIGCPRARSPRSSACSTPSSATKGEPDVVQISGGEPTIHPAVLRRARRRAPASDPPPDGQHQRRADRAGRGLRRAPGGVHARLRGLPAVRLLRARRADGAARRRSARRCASARSSA